MDSHKEISEWAKNLTEELNEIPNFLEKLEASSSLDSTLKQKFKNLTRLLQKSIEKFLKKCKKYSTKVILTERCLTNTKNEYFRLMQNIDNFYNTLRLSNLKPNYIQSTFTSRYRSQSAKKHKEALLSKAGSSKILPIKFNDVSFCNKVNYVTKKINLHSHKNYSSKLARLEKSNLKLHTKITFLQEETSENFQLAQNLMDRVGFLESSQ